MSGPVAALPLSHRFHDGAPDAPVLLLLHGTGGGPGDLLGLGRELSPRSALLAPAGPVSEFGAARWFRRLAEGVFDFEDVVKQSRRLAGFIRAARYRYALDDRRLVAVGFSNGANIAAATLLLHPEALREAVLFSAMSPLPDPPDTDLAGTRALLANGRRDPMAPLDSSEGLVRELTARGAAVTTAWHPGGHTITPSGRTAARAWIAEGAGG
ncbi:alpha/beta hydrolase [Allonocardiopsis opalescens]|uniref:Phospholipase/carboxylesterase n=1 Tax=Allonocardiopsis opalescens TaxID=1144618 RepID=A0A2T0Q4H0_9ACTN|nr:alpha/beta hydrolase [Allonocardiopsis opalescens]PRX98669.1 phospholipase/carboxylesterase [Allonocardiopsis opalescens]